MISIIFNLLVAVAGASLIIFRNVLARKSMLLSESLGAKKPDDFSKQMRLFSGVLLAIGTGIISFGFFNVLGFVEIGFILLLNIVFLSIAAYGIGSRKNYKGFQRITAGIVAGIVIAMVLFFNFSIYQSIRPAELSIHDNRLSVYSFGFGVEADVKDIKQVAIIDHLPEVNLRLNGFGLGKYQRGLYSLKDNSTVHIFLETNKSEFLNIKFNHANDIYLNYDPNDPVQQQLVNLKK